MDFHVLTDEERAKVAAELQERTDRLRQKAVEKEEAAARRRGRRSQEDSQDRLPYRDPE